MKKFIASLKRAFNFKKEETPYQVVTAFDGFVDADQQLLLNHFFVSPVCQNTWESIWRQIGQKPPFEVSKKQAMHFYASQKSVKTLDSATLSNDKKVQNFVWGNTQRSVPVGKYHVLILVSPAKPNEYTFAHKPKTPKPKKPQAVASK